jgi:large subunit ribosomal protein L13e
MEAMVNNGSRAGRGFSLEELKEAGMKVSTARNIGIPTDVWRQTKYPENVEKLKSAAKSISEAPPKEKPAKKEEPAKKPSKPKTAKKAAKKASKKKQKKRKK